MKLDAKQLRVSRPTQDQLDKLQRRPFYFVLDNVLDTYNIGSIFRLADAVGVAEVILCGGSETPPSSRIHKAAVGTEEWVKWRYFKNTTEFLEEFRMMNDECSVIAVEQDPKAVSLFDIQHSTFSGIPVAIVVGHETDGVSREVLDLVDQIVEIPMYGVNKSLNVHVSLAVVCYNLAEFYEK